MMKLYLILFCLLIVSSSALAAEGEKMQSGHEDDLNYSLGYQLGRDLLAAGIELREEALYQAIFAALATDQPELSREEMSALVRQMQEQKK